MALKKLVAGNWKMNGRRADLPEIEAIAAAAAAHSGVDVALGLPATLIGPAAAVVPGFAIGGQDCHWQASGAHTGCVSVDMLKEAGAAFVIVGHSERRTDNHETSADVQKKAQAAMAGGLMAIICVGETEAQRDVGAAISVVTDQVRASVPAQATGAIAAIAYEPVWAIGTGRTPSAADVAEMHAAIRAELQAILGAEGAHLRLLYGGSVKASNAAELLHLPNVDGALVGGASLKAADFVPIIEAARA
ncbi:MAG: triose-phosphate isomerase [Sphingomonadaceae bacterium]|nr:triose-phosphate isomerase [Sphingomonadaceae bacterium]NCA01517.1 triose-phosphate isomerase [Sphingomonadaceae bacterium]